MTVKLSKTNQNKLSALGVQALYLFGSRALGVAGPLSDYDFGVLMPEEGHKRGGKLYDEIYDILSPLCPRTLENDIIDIIFVRDAPLELRFHIIRYGKVLFDAAPRDRGRFEDNTTMLYCDYRPLLDMFDKAILATL
jgi:predicted nucleotidyltransferase